MDDKPTLEEMSSGAIRKALEWREEAEHQARRADAWAALAAALIHGDQAALAAAQVMLRQLDLDWFTGKPIEKPNPYRWLPVVLKP